MKRVFLAGLIGAAILLLSHRPAFAMVEFCPATLAYDRVGSDTALIRQQSRIDRTGKATNETSSLFGFELMALGGRTITAAKLAFDTSGGWYTLDVPAVTLAEKDRHYSAPWVTFIHRDFVSPVLYVRFPQAVSISHAWVYEATAQNDGAFGWQAIGAVMCDPIPEASPEQRAHWPKPARSRNPYTLDPKDEDRLSDVPSAMSLVLNAAPSAPLESAACTEPFREATVTRPEQPQYPDVLRGRVGSDVMTSVEVAIEPDGTLQDDWVWAPSGFKPFDDASLDAARRSTYKGARAYCRAVPGEYYFRVTFDPN